MREAEAVRHRASAVAEPMNRRGPALLRAGPRGVGPSAPAGRIPSWAPPRSQPPPRTPVRGCRGGGGRGAVGGPRRAQPGAAGAVRPPRARCWSWRAPDRAKRGSSPTASPSCAHPKGAPSGSSRSPSRTGRPGDGGARRRAPRRSQPGRMWVMTFHAACARILRAEAVRARVPAGLHDLRPGRPDPGRQGRASRTASTRIRSGTRRAASTPASPDAKNRLIKPEASSSNEAVDGFFDEIVAEVYTAYQRRLQLAGAMDFDDLLMHAVDLLENGVPDVREKWQERFRHVMVDECQDTNHAQYRLVPHARRQPAATSAWSATPTSRSTRGAAPTSGTSSTSRRTSRTRRWIRLEQNYRSTQRYPRRGERASSRTTPWSPGEAAVVRPRRGARRCGSSSARTSRARRGSSLSQIGVPPNDGYARASDVAIFYRTNAQSRVMEDLLRRHDIVLPGRGRPQDSTTAPR